MSTPSRKDDHLRLCFDGDVEFTGRTAGFETVSLVHRPVPEVSPEDVDLFPATER